MSAHDPKSRRWRLIVAALLVASGELAAVWLAVACREPWGWVVGPAVLASTFVLAGFWLQPLGGSRILKVAVTYAAIVITVCALSAGDPENLREILVLCGGALGGLFVIVAPDLVTGERRLC